ncbi:MAG: DNA primase, partial [Armatimonadetes bacterium]|nr:DNA primase [Armatimonadota bacterium]
MRGRLSSDIKEEIRTRVDLVELAGEHVALKKTGRYYKGLCPFHQEKTPSFHVDREKGLWHCFGCQAGGDAYDFVMRISNLSFSESVEVLARRAGVRLERTPDEARRASERDRLYRALDAAAVWYREQLLQPEKGKAARDYLKGRGVDETTAERFRLGYAPQAWDELLKALSSKGYPPTQLEKGGLINPRPSGDGHYDLLRHRLIFPIVDLQDRPVAFGGRALDQAEPKYLNTKETPLFSKGRTLYALNLAREAIRHTDEVIVVEGNMDALTCHQFGFTNAVASLGTSLTLDQVLLMKRFASQAVLVYDSDASGLRAMERAMGLFEEAEMSVRVVVLPSGDPDAYLRETGGEAFRSLVMQALPVFEYQLAMATSRHDPKSVEGKVRITEELVPILAAVRNPIRQAEYIREVAERLDLREDALRQRLRGTVRGRSAVEVSMPVLAGPDRARHQAERILLHLMVLEPPLRETVAGQLSASEFADPRHQALAGVLLGSREGPEVLQELIEDEEAKRLLMHLVF